MASMQEFDSNGSNNKAPRLLNIADFSMWKFRMQQFFYLSDATLWESIVKGPHIPIAKAADSDLILPKDPTQYNELDKKLIERDLKALASLTTALPNEILHGFKKHTTAKDLWDALTMRYEGNDELQENRKDTLRKQYETFTIQKGEPVCVMINRYTHLLTDLQAAGLINYSQEQLNKKLLDALPNSWNIMSLVIKKTNNLKTLSTDELIGQIQSSESSMKKDDQSQINPYNSSTGCALISNYSQFTPSFVSAFSSPSHTIPVFASTSEASPSHSQAAHSGSSVTDKYPNLSAGNPKILEENLGLCSAFLASYEAFASGVRSGILELSLK